MKQKMYHLFSGHEVASTAFFLFLHHHSEVVLTPPDATRRETSKDLSC